MNKTNCVSKFVNYMLDKFSLEEALIIWDGDPDNKFDMAHHFWNKFDGYRSRGTRFAAISHLVAETSEDYLEPLFERAGTPQDERKVILSTFIYMWNSFCDEEFINLFGSMVGNLLCEKYGDFYDDYGSHGCVTALLDFLDEPHMGMLIGRATYLYCGRHNKV